MLLAVLETRVGFKLAQKDVFLNIAGGLKVNDPAIDLAVNSAILSSNMDAAIEPEVCMAGEIGLSGEIRPVKDVYKRQTFLLRHFDSTAERNVGANLIEDII